jgi:two-component system, chemotaxis family, CheB/CheR fusion protein
MTRSKDSRNNEEDAAGLDELLAYMRDARCFDFSGYKRASLTRRIRKRMSTVGVSDFPAYQDLLEADADEFGQLFDTILINVTSFFRDPECWELLRAEIVPDIVARLHPDQPLRLWCPGCSSGEEAYSLAITIAEVMGVEAFNERVKIYATDIDEDALRTARQGVYPAKAVEGRVPEELRERYFNRVDANYEFRLDLRRQIIFGRHDVTADAPISHLQLLSCRNTLMYFNADTQSQVIDRFQFALVEGGYLFLGRAEMLLSDSERFEVVNMPLRVFRRRSGERVIAKLHPGVARVNTTISPNAMRDRQLRDLALAGAPQAHVIVDTDDVVVIINNQARTMFGLTARDEGRLLRDLEISYRPVELRSLIEQAQTERRFIRVNAVERSIGPGEVQYVDVQIHPLKADDGAVIGADVVFTDVTTPVRHQQDAKQAREDLETAYEELQSTNEELETTNEELQSTNEELETTNEELQSTNEELETTNEELQSTNEELETMNEELRTRTSELDEIGRYLRGVLASVPVAVVVVDGHLRVQLWNAGAEEMWGLREPEVRGEGFFALDFGLPTGQLRSRVRGCLAGEGSERVEIDAVNRRGRSFVCAVECSPLGTEGEGAVLLMGEELPA